MVWFISIISILAVFIAIGLSTFKKPASTSIDYRVTGKVNDTTENYFIVLRSTDSTSLSFISGNSFWDSCNVNDVLIVKYKLKR